MKYILMLCTVLFTTSTMAVDMVVDPNLVAYDRALIQVVDKKKSQSQQIELQVGEKMLFEDLQFNVKKCYERYENSRDFWFFVEIQDKQREFETEEVSRVFSGWMSSKSPSLSALEHPVYDVQLIKCFSSTAVVKEKTQEE